MTPEQHGLSQAAIMQRRLRNRILDYALQRRDQIKWRRVVYMLSYGASVRRVLTRQVER